MKTKEIVNIAEATFKQFPHKIKRPVFKVMNKTKFSKYLKDSTFEVNLKKTPAFVAHLPDGELVVFCREVIEGLMKNKGKEDKIVFIEAVTIHELFHIWNKCRTITAEEALLSEKQVHKEIKKEFPELFKVLDKFR